MKESISKLAKSREKQLRFRAILHRVGSYRPLEDGVTKRQADIVFLRVYAKLPVAKIAKLLGISQARVYQICKREAREFHWRLTGNIVCHPRVCKIHHGPNGW